MWKTSLCNFLRLLFIYTLCKCSCSPHHVNKWTYALIYYSRFFVSNTQFISVMSQGDCKLQFSSLFLSLEFIQMESQCVSFQMRRQVRILQSSLVTNNWIKQISGKRELYFFNVVTYPCKQHWLYMFLLLFNQRCIIK